MKKLNSVRVGCKHAPFKATVTLCDGTVGYGHGNSTRQAVEAAYRDAEERRFSPGVLSNHPEGDADAGERVST